MTRNEKLKGARLYSALIQNRITHLLRGPEFAERFLAKGRYRPRMTRIPVKLVTTGEPGLLGAAVAFRRGWPD